MTFLDRLDTLMREKGLSKSRLAQVSGVPYTTIDGFYKKGYENTKLSTIRKLAAALDVCIDDLVVSECPAVEKLHTASDKALRVAKLYDLASAREQEIIDLMLKPYESKLNEAAPESKVLTFPKKKKPRKDGFEDLDVYDQPAAAGLGNYLDVPVSQKQQYPAGYIPNGTSFGILISGDSMQPRIANGATAFVQAAPALDSGEVGIFVLNGQSYCKQLVIDRERREVRLHSVNPKYDDIPVRESDELRTIGRVLDSYPQYGETDD